MHEIISHNGNEYTYEEFKDFLLDLKTSTFENRSSVFSSIPKILAGGGYDSDSNILDFGSGLGQVSAYMHEQYSASIDAVEPDKDWREKSKLVWNDKLNYDINFIDLDDFSFPVNRYDLVISTAVIEHVHNPGTYLHNIGKMLKEDGRLLIGFPNGENLRTLFTQFRYSKKTVIKRSKKVLQSYNKPNYHINSWDAYHFTTLLASCGFEVLEFVHNGGIPLPIVNIPFIGKYLPGYIYLNIPILNRLSYGMYFLVRKSKKVTIACAD